MDTTHNDMLEQIKKILLMSQLNGFAGEDAVNAALAAQRLVADNAAAQRKPPAYVRVTAEDRAIIKTGMEETRLASVGATWTSEWNSSLAAAVAPNFRCEYYFGRSQKADECRPRKVVRFFGQKTDALAAKLVYEHLLQAATKCGNAFVQTHTYELDGQVGDGASQAELFNTWVHGFIEGVKDRLDQQAWELSIYVPQMVQRAYAKISQDFASVPIREVRRTNDQAVLNAGRSCSRAGLGASKPAHRLNA